jgi:hypothetical protein
MVNLTSGKLADAIADHDAALRISPKTASLRHGRGTARQRTGDAAGGDTDIAEARALRPGLAEEFARCGVWQSISGLRGTISKHVRVICACIATATAGSPDRDQSIDFVDLFLAETEGFEPSVHLESVQQFSKLPPSATRPRLRARKTPIPSGLVRQWACSSANAENAPNANGNSPVYYGIYYAVFHRSPLVDAD